MVEMIAITRTNHTPSGNIPLATLTEQPLPLHTKSPKLLTEQPLQTQVTKFDTSDNLQ
jgi:hypothetical protein